MTIEGFVKFEYSSKSVPPYYGSYSCGLVDDENITIQTTNLQLDIHQYFTLFKKFLFSVGFCEETIISGACNLAFNELNDENLMKKVAKNYDLILSEELADIMNERVKEELEYIKKTSEYSTIDSDSKVCDKNDVTEECKKSWTSFWNEE